MDLLQLTVTVKKWTLQEREVLNSTSFSRSRHIRRVAFEGNNDYISSEKHWHSVLKY